MFKEILKEYIELKDISQLELSNLMGSSQQAISDFLKKKSAPRMSTKNKYFNSLEGFKSFYDQKSILKQAKNNNKQAEQEASELDYNKINLMLVPLVSKFAYAGYLDNLGDDEYMEDLPKVAFESYTKNKGDYLAFEVKGDSMDNGLSNAILEGDVLLARNVKQEYWRSKLHIRKWNFIIVHRERGILIKRITEHNTDTNEITIHSLNDYYEDDVIHLKNVQSIYNVVDIKRKPIL